MSPLPLSLHRSIARLLAAVVLMLGLMDPSLSLADTMQDYAPGQCVSMNADRHHAPLAAISNFDLGDDGADLEQLLRPLLSRKTPATPGLADFPALAILLPPPHSPPLLRPPAFHA